MDRIQALLSKSQKIGTGDHREGENAEPQSDQATFRVQSVDALALKSQKFGIGDHHEGENAEPQSNQATFVGRVSMLLLGG